MTEYKTTLGSYSTSGRAISGRYEESSADDPVVPEGDGWRMCGSSAADNVVLWFWMRETTPFDAPIRTLRGRQSWDNWTDEDRATERAFGHDLFVEGLRARLVNDCTLVSAEVGRDNDGPMWIVCTDWSGIVETVHLSVPEVGFASPATCDDVAARIRKHLKERA